MAMAGRHCQGRVVSSLEGGYDLAALAEAVAAHVRVLMTAIGG
jgi:acetoin utilization deacetylase AcuC-like enzyme